MKKQDAVFWALVVTFIFGVALHWPLWFKLITLVLAGMVLAQVCGRFAQTYSKGR